MSNWYKVQKGINRLYDEMEDTVNAHIDAQNCQSEQDFKKLLDEINDIETYDFEKEMYERCIERKLDTFLHDK